MRALLSEQVRETIDHVTGEIVTTETTRVSKVDRTPDFVMLFTRDLGYVKDISGGATKLLFGLMKFVDRNNEITLNKARKDQVAEMIGIKQASVNPLLSQLVKHDVLTKGIGQTGIYTLNPYIFGKGQWKNISKLRMMVEYDFDQGTKKVAYEADYNEPDEDDIVEKILANKEAFLKYLEDSKGAN